MRVERSVRLLRNGQPDPAAAKMGALLVDRVLNARRQPHGVEGAEEACVELAVGLLDLASVIGGVGHTPSQAFVRP